MGSSTSDEASAQKPRAKKSARPDDVELTPAQKKKQEKEDRIREARERYERYGETPSRIRDNAFLGMNSCTRRRPAYPAYDERHSKRPKLCHVPVPRGRAKARRAPAKKAIPKKPSSPLRNSPANTPLSRRKGRKGRKGRPNGSHKDRTNESNKGDHTDARSDLLELPPELRHDILCYILVWPSGIPVFNGWDLVFPRKRPRLDLSILRTCRLLANQGLQILFGENEFTYSLKDPRKSHEHTSVVLEKVFDDCLLPINKYGHLIRHMRINMPSSRVQFSDHRRKFEGALEKFLPGGGLADAFNLHTLTLEVPAVRNSDLQGQTEMSEQPDEIPICQYLRQGSKIINAILKLRIQWVRVLAWDASKKCWQTNIDMRYYAKDEQMRLEHEAALQERGASGVGGDQNQNIPGKIATAVAAYRNRDVEAIEERWDKNVKQAVTALHNLAWRIECLVVEPERAVKEWKFWVPVEDPETNAKKEFVELPRNFKEPSMACKPSKRRRPANTRAKACAVATRRRSPAIESDASDKTMAPTEVHQNELEEPDIEKVETALRAWAKAEEEREASLQERGMLTEAWLETQQ
ncbi:hypothetical protein F4777DRAFT_175742 [Nemania sp. FL0916]|nr:hypothetical protein F4777DRAFT_175742 [Nemania sp. FL0916]